MPDIVPVEHDPFGDAPYALPVDHVPEFGDAPMLRAGSIGAPERAPGESVGGIALDLLSQIPGAVRGALSLPQRVANESERMRYGVGYDPGPAVEASMLTMGATPLGAGEAALGAGPVKPSKQALSLANAGDQTPQGIRAYHGSPHDFERFDMSKIGTGEGAQAYGHGLYFAENPETAESYRQTFDLANKAARTTARLEGQEVPPVAPKARMYEVNINANPEHFLDWDKPLSEQPEHVRKALEPLRQDISREWQEANPTLGEPTHTGQIIAARGPEASEYLRSAGIPGIKYLDQGSRSGNYWMDVANDGTISVLGPGRQSFGTFPTREAALSFSKAKNAESATRNYVLFRDDIINILRKYGLAGLSALPPAVAASVHKQMFQPVDHDPFQ